MTYAQLSRRICPLHCSKFAAAQMSPVGPSRHFAAAQHFVAFRPKRTLSRKLHYFDSLMFEFPDAIELVS